MRFSDKTKVHRIEKSLSEVSHKEEAAIYKLIGKLERQVPSMSIKAVGLLAGQRVGGYEKEIREIARAINMSPSLLLGANLVYDLSHAEYIGLGCTSAVKYTEEHGMVHMRCLDWDMSELGRLTRVFKQENSMMVGFSGFSGALSGMVDGEFSVSMNWAPPEEAPNLQSLQSTDISPPFLLRMVLDTAENFDVAYQLLTTTRLSSSAFFTLCGKEKGQACLIERIASEFDVVPMGRSGILVQTNHFQTKNFTDLNEENGHEDEEDIYNVAHSKLRRSKMLAAVTNLSSLKKLEQYRKPLTLAEIENGDTCQQMVFAPKSAQYRLWRKT